MSLLGDSNRRRGVQVFRPLPQAPQPAPMPVAGPTAAASPLAAMAAQARAYEAEHPKEDQGGAGGLWPKLGQGLGMLVNNPIVETALKPLSVLAIPGAAVTGTVKEGLDVVGEPLAKGIENVLAPLGLAERTDWQNNNPYDGSFDFGDLWDAIKAKKGFGEQIVEPAFASDPREDSVWGKRALGLIGDIAADPLRGVKGIGYATEAAGTRNSPA